jgi:hypothetical protein
VQFPPGVAILPDYAVYSKRGQSSSWAGGWEAEHDRQSGVPDGGTTACLFRLGPHSAVTRGRESRIARKREPAAAAQGAGTLAISSGGRRRPHGNIDPRYGAGPAGATASPGEPISTRIGYRTESVVISHSTSAWTQCKSPASRPSCGIAPTDGALSAIRASEVGP